MKRLIRFLSTFGLGLVLTKSIGIISNTFGYSLNTWVPISIYGTLAVLWILYELHKNKNKT